MNYHILYEAAFPLLVIQLEAGESVKAESGAMVSMTLAVREMLKLVNDKKEDVPVARIDDEGTSSFLFIAGLRNKCAFHLQ